MSANEHPESDDLQPDKDEVLQNEEIPDVAVAVRIESPVRTTSLPNKGGATKTLTIGTTTPVRMVNADHRRAKATFISIGANALFALNNASAQDPSRMALWPQNVPYVVTADTEVWVLSASATTSISVTTELWAEGNSQA